VCDLALSDCLLSSQTGHYLDVIWQNVKVAFVSTFAESLWDAVRKV
jgi:hypothetical protein